MARYDICELKKKGAYRLVVMLQADVLDSLPTRLIAPLVPASSGQKATRLNPEFDVADKRMLMLTEQMVSVPSIVIGRVVGNVAEHDFEIGLALDMLLKGF
ncbi:MAG: CcdB family protein [Alphaproteobacteria bacterium]|nr:CcdB family protein [Alphaproteobacteria bacterium]